MPYFDSMSINADLDPLPLKFCSLYNLNYITPAFSSLKITQSEFSPAIFTRVIDGNSISNSLTNELSQLRNYFESASRWNILGDFAGISTDVKKNYSSFMMILSEMLELCSVVNPDIFDAIPPITVRALDDKTISLSWVFPDFRITFSFGGSHSDNYWFLVTNSKFDELTNSGHLSPEKYGHAISVVFNFIIRNV